MPTQGSQSGYFATYFLPKGEPPARYWRLRYTLNRYEGAEFIGGEARPPPQRVRFDLPDLRSLGFADPAHRYAPIECCIYCGARSFRPGSGRRLGDEHIIAEGLGARLILPEASCDRCAARTCSVESFVLAELLATRAGLNVRRKPRTRPSTARLKILSGDKEDTREVPLAELPLMLLLPEFLAPRCLSLRDANSHDYAGVFAHNEGDPVPLVGRGNSFASPVIDTLRFSQMLAKIGHAYATAELGRAAFRPLLDGFAIRKFDRSDSHRDHFEWIGGYPGSFEPSDALHQIALRREEVGFRKYVIVTFRLFSKLGTPAYDIVVGEI